jgi:hypothetical protein
MSSRVDTALAEFEYNIWEAIVYGELEPNSDLKFSFKVKRHGTEIEDTVDVVVSIRKQHATD